MTRSEALEYFREELKDGKCSDTCPICNAMEWAIKALEQPERKKGKWEEEEVFDDLAIALWQSARCSACGLYHTTPYMYYFSRYNYCPHCGADMRKENTDETN